MTEQVQAVTLLSPAVGTGNVGDHFIEAAIRRLLGTDVEYLRVGIRDPLTQTDIRDINATDCALLCGTNLYQRDWHSALTVEALEAIEVPVIPFGVGGSAAELSDHSVGPVTAQMIRALHSRCDLSSVRDPHAADVLAELGVENALLTGCPVLFWQGGTTLPEIATAPRRHIVITARNWLMHRWPENVDHPVQIRLLERLLQAFPSEQLTYAVHEEYDLRLIKRLGIPAGMVFHSDRPEDYFELYSDPANVVFAMRLHAGMLALANGVPAVFVGHDTRTYSFCDLMDIDYIELFSDSCPELCVDALQRALDGDPGSLARAPARYTALRPSMDRFMGANGLAAEWAGEPEALSR
jgi:hypothetical protein